MGEKAEITIERMRKDDLDQVMAIEVASFTMPWSRNLFLSEFRNPAVSLMLVALSGKESREVVGYIVCWIVAGELHILNLATKSEFRRKGIATGLVLAALKDAYARGARRAFLEVRVSNEDAQLLYEKLGFVRSLVRKDYYDLPVEDAVIMTLEQEEFLRLIG